MADTLAGKRYKCSCSERHEAPETLAALIDGIGPNIRVRGAGGPWWVPRIFIAVHGRPPEEDMAVLAYDYGWKPVNSPRRSA